MPTGNPPFVMPKLCPICGKLRVKQTIDGMEYWVCPKCGYIEPLNDQSQL